MNVDEKLCPFCSEVIKSAAIKCKHCSTLLTSDHPLSAERHQSVESIKKVSSFFSGANPWLLAALAVAAIFVATNPTPNDFQNFMAEKIARSADLENSGAFGKLAAGMATLAVSSMTRHKDYYAFSIFEMDSPLLRALNPNAPRMKFVGILQQIIPLNSTEQALKPPPPPSPTQIATPSGSSPSSNPGKPAKYPRCAGSYEPEKCAADEEKLALESPEQKSARQKRLQEDRDRNIEEALSQ